MLARENVQSYPRPPVVEPVHERVRVLLGGTVVADSVHAVRVIETHHAPTYYIPFEDVAVPLKSAAGSSFCEWKGQAEYWTVSAGGATAVAAAWSYPTPTPGFQALKGRVAFYAGKMEACYVGDERVLPQPGDFYGGWVTPEIRGPFKGGPGTMGW